MSRTQSDARRAETAKTGDRETAGERKMDTERDARDIVENARTTGGLADLEKPAPKGTTARKLEEAARKNDRKA